MALFNIPPNKMVSFLPLERTCLLSYSCACSLSLKMSRCNRRERQLWTKARVSMRSWRQESGMRGLMAPILSVIRRNSHLLKVRGKVRTLVTRSQADAYRQCRGPHWDGEDGCGWWPGVSCWATRQPACEPGPPRSPRSVQGSPVLTSWRLGFFPLKRRIISAAWAGSED